jgi:hypothetical protein
VFMSPKSRKRRHLTIHYVELFWLFSNSYFFRGIPFRSVLVTSFGIGSSAEIGMARNEHFLPRNNRNHSESIPRNFFGTKFRSQPYSCREQCGAGGGGCYSPPYILTLPTHSCSKTHARTFTTQYRIQNTEN